MRTVWREVVTKPAVHGPKRLGRVANSEILKSSPQPTKHPQPHPRHSSHHPHTLAHSFAMASPEPEPSILFKKKKSKGRPAALRKRSPSPSASTSTSSAPTADPEPSAVVQSTRKHTANHLIQGTGGFKRRRQEADDVALASSDEDEVGKGQDGFGVKYSSKTVRERRRSSSPPAEVSMNVPVARAEPGEDDGLYRGAAKQQHNVNKSFGPIKGGPSNVRTITLVDYQPDVCKDYKGKSLAPSFSPSPRRHR